MSARETAELLLQVGRLVQAEGYDGHGIDAKPYLADILAKLVNGWPMAKIDEFCPGHGPNKGKSALRPNRIFHQFGGSASETSCASLASA